MKIHNVRLGFATNSSSTHSIVFLPHPHQAKDDDVSEQKFGWEYFTAGSKESKSAWLAHVVKSEVAVTAGLDIADVVARSICPSVNEDGYVDHQSVPTLPLSYDRRGIDVGFVRAFASMLGRDDVAILGGNDNDEESHPLSMSARHSFDLPYLDGGGRTDRVNDLVCRNDGEFWTIFNQRTGAKIRMSFDEHGTTKRYLKASTPELVDVKITDHCAYGCTYCYQGSTPKGKHADRNALSSLAYTLAGMKVFEVAIGGGEPTTHPDFVSVLHWFRTYGVVPNFTTRNLRYLYGKHAEAVAELLGACAVSVDERTGYEDTFRAIEESPFGDKIGIQYVIGSGSDAFLTRLSAECTKREVPLTLLGYKTVGRGTDALPVLGATVEDQSKTWADCIRKSVDENVRYGYTRVGIDTALAESSTSILAANKVPDMFYTVHEGDFSMYVDAVAETVAPSSYCNPQQVTKVKGLYEDELRRVFSSWT